MYRLASRVRVVLSYDLYGGLSNQLYGHIDLLTLGLLAGAEVVIPKCGFRPPSHDTCRWSHHQTAASRSGQHHRRQIWPARMSAGAWYGSEQMLMQCSVFCMSFPTVNVSPSNRRR